MPNALPTCHGNNDRHCCNLGFLGVCPHVEERTVEGRRWACGLLRQLGNWELVHTDPRYVADVQPFFDDLSKRLPDYPYGLSCGEWRHPNQCCFADETPVSLGESDG